MPAVGVPIALVPQYEEGRGRPVYPNEITKSEAPDGLATIPHVQDEMARMESVVKVTAHRGSSAESPENTLAALRQAIEDGADYAEVDFLQAKDGTIVMLHDENLQRVAGVDRYVYDLTGDELRALDVGKWFDPRFEGEKIATLEEAITHVKGKIRLNIELKVHGREKGFAEAAVQTIRDLDFGDECVITSLDQAILTRVRQLDPDLRIGMIITAKVGRASDLDVDFYSVEANVATVRFVRSAHKDGREVHVWTLNEEKAMRDAIDRGADNLITDYPRRARVILDERTATDDLGAAVSRLFRE